MENIEYIEYLRNLLKELGENRFKRALYQYLINVMNNGESLVDISEIRRLESSAERTLAIIEQIIRDFREVDVGSIYVDVRDLIKVIDLVDHLQYGKSYKLLSILLSQFEKTFSRFIGNSSQQNATSLYYAAINLLLTWNNVIQIIDEEIVGLQHSFILRDNEKPLKLFLYNTNEYKDFYEKLKNLGELYKEICLIFNVSESEYPLRVEKIESGSLLIYVVGNAAVIAFIILLLKETAKFFYRNYTLEGRITQIPKELETAEKILKFTKKLEEAGVDTTENKERIQKVLFTVTDKLNNLVADQPKVKIDDQTLSVGDEYEEKFLEESRIHLIGDGSESTETESKTDNENQS